MSERPPIFSKSSLRSAARIIAIYCVVSLVVFFIKFVSDPPGDPTVPANAYDPQYLMAGIHFLFLLICLLLLRLSKLSWWVIIPMIALILYLRIDYQNFAIWVWSWS